MKRWLRRTAAIIVGLGLGWWAAGLIEASLRAGGGAGVESAGVSAPGFEASKSDPAVVVARELVPSAEDVRLLRPAVWIGAGLFVAAVVLGVPALRGEDSSSDRDRRQTAQS